MMFGKRFVVMCSTVAVIAFGVGALTGTSHVAASSSKHRVVLKGPGTSSAVEATARAVFSCDASTGAYTVTVNNVQVIQSDQFTAWPDDPNITGTQYGALWTLAGATVLQGSIPLTQNSKSGLYGGSASGAMTDASQWCASGITVSIADETLTGPSFTHQWLFLQKSLR